MKADAVQIGPMLAERQTFVVPLYQRRFAWHEDRLELFWDDVIGKANEALIGKTKRFAHYMGALIVLPIPYDVGRVQALYLVDGQQRLTTFQIFLAANP